MKGLFLDRMKTEEILASVDHLNDRLKEIEAEEIKIREKLALMTHELIQRTVNLNLK
jgi:hypothetical protein